MKTPYTNGEIKEDNIINWAKSNDLKFLNCACRFTEMSSYDESLSKRKEIKNLIKELKKTNPNIDDNIFTSMSNVNLNCVLEYKLEDKKYNFLDRYE